MNPNETHVVLGIDPNDRDLALVDSQVDDTRTHDAVHRRHPKPAYPIAHLDEKQHALAFEMRYLVVAACVAAC